ncbi:MAG TPA: hypothetical protein V6D29_19800 [Leptolyngbyaceae cyanobacterium]
MPTSVSFENSKSYLARISRSIAKASAGEEGSTLAKELAQEPVLLKPELIIPRPFILSGL